MKSTLSILLTIICFMQPWSMHSQTDIVTYAGNSGKETFYDVTQLSDGTFLVCGFADDLDWIDTSVPKIQLTNTSAIPHGLGTNKFGFVIHFSADLQNMIEVIHFPQNNVEDVRFIKTNSLPYHTTGDLYISGNTADTDNNNGGYFIAKLNNNFVNGTPTGLEWVNIVWAKSGPKDYHPWDVTSDGRVFYISGEAHGYDWSAMYCLNNLGQRMAVENWRTHWLTDNSEWHGTPASSNPLGSLDQVRYSGIVLKMWGRCDLRSWTQEEYSQMMPDGNGGTRQGKWPVDVLFNGPCDPTNPTHDGPGYTGYTATSCCPVYGGSCLSIDRRDNHVYIGMNMKSTSDAANGNSPDFEPAVIAMDGEGMLLWWSRLYHEITPDGQIRESIPDQYIDALAIDYANNKLVVGARCHGNNTENFWEGNTITSDPSAYGFQNQFTGTFGNIHLSWLGKLTLEGGNLTNSTYMAEMFEGTGSLGTPHPDPNLDGWPDPNTGWPDVNTTRMAKNALKVTSTGDVCVAALGRRTITTANAYQKMVKPYYGGKSCWNSFVRIYDEQFHLPKYSSLVVGQWDTLTQAGGGNTELFGIYKVNDGIICVGHHTADTTGLASGNPIPVNAVPTWGQSTPQNQSAILVYYKAPNLVNPNDGFETNVVGIEKVSQHFDIYPNPAEDQLWIRPRLGNDHSVWTYQLEDLTGKTVLKGRLTTQVISVSDLPSGMYVLELKDQEGRKQQSKVIVK